MTPAAAPPPVLVVRGRTVDLSAPVVMGIADVGDAGAAVADLVAHALALADAGATIVDVSASSPTGPATVVALADEAVTLGAAGGAVDADPDGEAGTVEAAGLGEVVAGVLAERPDVLVAVDAAEPAVVAAALAAGAAIVRGPHDPEVAALCVEAGAGLVVTPGEVAGAERRGVPWQALIIEPEPPSVPAHEGRPVLIDLAGRDMVGTLAAVEVLAAPGTILRVRDVAAVADYLAVAGVLAGRIELDPTTELPPELRREPPKR